MTDLNRLVLAAFKALPPELAHDTAMTALRWRVGLPDVRPDFWGTATCLPKSGLNLSNPVGLAAGFDKNGAACDALARFGFGFVECGTITPQPQAGNPKPRLFRLADDQGIINRMGFNNHGLDRCIRGLQARRPSGPCPVGVNIGPNRDSADPAVDYQTGLSRIRPHADYVTLNISSPNTPGLRRLHARDALASLLQRCETTLDTQSGKKCPVFLKITPDIDDEATGDILTLVRDHGHWLSGLIVANSTTDRPETLKSIYKTQAGGLSGRPVMAKSTRLLKQIAGQLAGTFDLIGCGGIFSGVDAYAKIRAGAHAVQIYSGLVFHGPGLVARINAELAACLQRDGFSSVAAAVGADL